MLITAGAAGVLFLVGLLCGDGDRIGLGAFAARLSPRTQPVMLASPQNPRA